MARTYLTEILNFINSMCRGISSLRSEIPDLGRYVGTNEKFRELQGIHDQTNNHKKAIFIYDSRNKHHWNTVNHPTGQL